MRNVSWTILTLKIFIKKKGKENFVLLLDQTKKNKNIDVSS